MNLPLLNLFLGTFSGILVSLSFPKWNLFYLAFVSLFPVFLAFRFSKDIKEVTLTSLCFGISHFVSLLYWIVYTLIKFGNLNLFVSISLLLLLSLYLSLYYLIPFLLAFRLKIFDQPSFLKGLILSFFITGSEYLRSIIFTGFPWGQLGYLMTNFSLVLQIADIFGVWGLTFFTIKTNYFLFYIFCIRFIDKSYKTFSFFYQTSLFLVLIGLVIFYGFYSKGKWEKLISSEKRSLRVALLQGNIPQEIKEAKQIEVSFSVYRDLIEKSLSEKPEIILFPETAFNFYFPYEKDPTLRLLSFLEEIKIKTYPENPTLILGMFRLSYVEGIPKVYNSLIVWFEGDFVDFYDKSKLVPFGEYVPLGNIFPFLREISVVSDVIKPGISKNLIIPLKSGFIKVAPLICFESAFSEILRDRLKEPVHLIYIATNDAWFGKTSAPYQHFQMAIVRAVEGRRYTIQVGNTGISGIISPTGKILSKSELETQTYLIGEIKPVHTFSYFRHTGNLLGLIGTILLLGYGIYFILLFFQNKVFPKK